MKNKIKALLASTVAAACLVSSMPLAGFAAGKQTASIAAGSISITDSEGSEVTEAVINEADEIVKKDGSGLFFVTVNGEKATENYGETSTEGLKEEKEDSEKSGNVYYESFTVPSAPKGYKVGAKITVKQNEDFYKTDNSFFKGNTVNLEYSPISYKVKFDLNGGEGKIEDVQANYGAEITLPASDSATKEGFSIIGWNTLADGSGIMHKPSSAVKNLTDKDNEEITLYAQWGEKEEDNEDNKDEVQKFTIEYYLSNTGPYTLIKEYAAGEKITLPETPVKEGFNFAGWILGEENGKVIPLPETMPEKNLKAYASWEIKEVKIDYIVDSEVVSSKKATYGSDIALTVPDDPVKEGYTFAGWYDDSGKNVYDYTTVPSSDTAFTAKWLKNGNVVYTVDKKTYKAYEVTEGEKIPVPENPKKFAHKFKGWSPEIPEVMGKEDLTFTAQWEIDKTFVTVVVGGTVIAGGVLTAIAGAGAAAITGLSIIGGIIALIGVASGINKSYTVTYKVDGKVYQTYKVSAGSAIPVPADPKKDGCKFAGWSPAIPSKMPKNNLTFEAKWTENDKDDSKVDTEIPSTGSGVAGFAAIASLAVSAVAAILIKKKKEK